jgi:hypothetical protein
MKCSYNISEAECKAVFGDLFEWEMEADYVELPDGGWSLVDRKYPTLRRQNQDYDGFVTVRLKTLLHAMILLDYLSYEKSSWDYEPKLRIYFGGESYIDFNRRGNYGHRHCLDKGDYLIIDSQVKAALDSGAIVGVSWSIHDYQEQVEKLIDTLSTQAKHIKRLEEELAFYKKKPVEAAAPIPVPDELPF